MPSLVFYNRPTLFSIPAHLCQHYCRWTTPNWDGWVDSNLFEMLPEFVRANPEEIAFLPESSVVRDARNLLNRVSVGEADVWLKRFRAAHAVDAAVYAFRAGKCVQSWNKSFALIACGFDVPKPLLGLRRRGVGQGAVGLYGSQHVESTPLRSFLSESHPEEDMMTLMRQLGVFVARLHDHGFRHRDLRRGNVLVQKCSDDSYRFFLVDVNRLQRYESLNWIQRIRELERLFLVGPEAEWFFEGYGADQSIGQAVIDYHRRVRYAEALENRRLGRLRKKLWYYFWELRAYPPGVRGSRPLSAWLDGVYSSRGTNVLR